MRVLMSFFTHSMFLYYSMENILLNIASYQDIGVIMRILKNGISS